MKARLSTAAFVVLFAMTAGAQTFGTPEASLGYDITPIYTFPLGAGGAPDINSSPTSIAYDAQNRLYVLTLEGRIFTLEDLDQDGTMETVTSFFDGRTSMPYPCDGLAYDAGAFYVAAQGQVWKIVDANGDLIPEIAAPIITGLPTGMHQNNGFAFDGNGKIYFGVGSQNDHGTPVHPYSATIMRANTNGTMLEVFATGMRNAFEIAYRPGLGLVCTENGWNSVFTDPSFDEINLVEQGKNYGFPVQTGPAPASSTITSPMAVLPAHSAPCGITFDPNDHWGGFPDDMYVAFVAAGAGTVARVSAWKHPITNQWHSFPYALATGFTAAIDLSFDAAGDLIVADFQTQVIYRIHASEVASIHISSPPRIGTLMNVTCRAPQNPNEYVILGISSAIFPPIGLPDGRVYPLDVSSFVFTYSTTPGNIVNQFSVPDTTDANGECNGSFYMPNVPGLDGFVLYTAFVTFTPALTFGAVSPPIGFSLFY